MAGSNESSNIIAGSLRRVWRYAGAPVDGTSGTYAGIVEKGDLLIDSTNANLYQNSNTQASPTWTIKAEGSGGSGPSAGAVGEMAVAGTSTANAAGVTAKYAMIDHVHALGTHTHSSATTGGAVTMGLVGVMAAAGTAEANGAGTGTTPAAIDHVHALGAHDHSSATKGGSVAMGLVGSMATAGTSTANAAGTGTAPAAIDHVHILGDHDHSGATKGSAIALAALAADFFTADATGRGKFQTGIFDAATVLDLFEANSFTNAILDSVLVTSAFAADSDSRAKFADGIWTAAKMAAGLLSADATGRALIASGFFDAATVLDAFANNSIPGSKVDWSYGTTPGNITPDDAAAAGSSANVARIDHVHGFSCAAPSGSHVPDCSNAEGSATTMVRSDHVHALACASPADGSLAAANAEGSSASSFARADHAHKAILLDDVSFNFGTGSDAQILLSAANLHASSTNEDLVIALSDNDQALHITDNGAKATNWNLADATHPTVYIHSNTTPATDYLALYHDATDGIIDAAGGNLVLQATEVELVSFAAAKTFFNEPGADIDFQISSNDVATMFVIDGGLNVLGIGVAASANSFVGIAHPAKTLITAAEFASVRVSPAGSITTAADSSTYDYLASLYLAEPNITKGAGDTITLAANLYILDAPTEATANYAIYVASGLTGVQALTAAGAITADAGIVVSAGQTLKLMGAQAGYNNDITDVNANELISLQGVATAINELTITNAAAGGSVDIGVSGGDTDITLGFTTKAAGQFDFAAGTPGTAAVPEIILQGDVDSGIYQPAANKLGIAVGGVGITAWAGGNMLLNDVTPDANTGTGVFILVNASVAPTGSQADGVVLYAADVASSELRVRDELGNDSVLSPHNDKGEYVINSYCAKTGTTFRVNLEKMLLKLAEKFPDDFAKMVEKADGFKKTHIK